jgi:hypothetical protein
LGSQGLCTDIKSILYKLVPSAISKKKKHWLILLSSN